MYNITSESKIIRQICYPPELSRDTFPWHQGHQNNRQRYSTKTAVNRLPRLAETWDQTCKAMI